MYNFSCKHIVDAKIATRSNVPMRKDHDGKIDNTHSAFGCHITRVISKKKSSTNSLV